VSQTHCCLSKFKTLPGINGSESTVTSKHRNCEQPAVADRLSPFARMLLDGTDLVHRCERTCLLNRAIESLICVSADPTPSSSDTASPPKRKTSQFPEPLSPKGKVGLLEPRQRLPTAPSTPQATFQNQVAFAYNSQTAIVDQTSSTAERQKQFPAIIVPPFPSDARPSEYIPVKDELGSRKRKRGDGTSYVAAATQTKDQRAAADEASGRLSDLVQEILDAEDQLHPDATASIQSDHAEFFVSTSKEHGGGRTLAPAIQVRLDTALQKSIAFGRLVDIPAGSLSRLQSLCEGAVASAESSKLEIEPSWSDEDFQHWTDRIKDVDLGLHSARTILRIMTGFREEKELYSEELLQGVIRLLDKVLRSCIIPVVEARNNESSLAFFEAARSHKKAISQLLYDATKAMGLLAELLAKVDMAENIINAVEFFAAHTLFVENAHMEKDSVLGIQKFETLRRTAMDMITEIFSRYTEQRASIFDEILTSLQKLPTTRLHARQYKLAAGINIQLVSALVLRLVQTSAQRTASKTMNGRAPASPSSDEGSEIEARADDVQNLSPDVKTGANSGKDSAVGRLSKIANMLSDSAGKSAQYVIRFFVSRAMTAPKTGDQPYRQLLDMFCEDLIAVVGQPEWPAAELLLRALLVHLVEIAEKPKFNAPAKNMALELLGFIGSAISDLVDSTRKAARSLDNDESEFSGYLRQLLDDYTDGALESDELLGWQGPYRAVVEYLQPKDVNDGQLRSAQAYYLTQWAKAVASGNHQDGPKAEKVAIQLCQSLTTSTWVTFEYVLYLPHAQHRTDNHNSSSEATTGIQSRLAYALTVLSMDLCRQFDRVLKILLDSISSEQITVRTRSLKSVTHMLEKDPSLLDRARNVKVLLTKCAVDRSSMVRDSALMLIGKCLLLRPALEQEFCKTVLMLSNDSAIGVRKRAMKLLKDMYLRSTQKEFRSAICDNLLQRIKDLDKSVSDLARQTFEEIWMSPLWSFGKVTEAKVQEKLALQTQVNLIIRTVQRGDEVSSVLASLIQELLQNSSKSAVANFKVCKALVAAAFDGMIYTENTTGRHEQRHILQTLTVFAKANARLFDPDQLKHLQPYIANLANSDDLHLFRSAVVVFRCVLPTVPTLQHTLLREVQTALLQSVAKLGMMELDEVAACLWTINGSLKNPEKLVKLTLSVLKNLEASKNEDYSNPTKKDILSRSKKYIRIAGYFGKYCDFEDQAKSFHEGLPWWKGSSVAGLIINCIFPYTNTAHQLSLRADAFNSLGLICQSRPYQFNQEQISSAFEKVLLGDEPELQNIVLSGFRDFFVKQEGQLEAKVQPALDEVKEAGNGKLGASMTASDSDSASALIAQRFLKAVLHIALASQDASALTATEVIASINRQGLVHPKESAPALVALETSTNPAIADVAFQVHRNLHQQHESMFEREYMRAITEAFSYQKTIVKSTSGYTTQPYTSKLAPMFDIIKTSKGVYQKKFLAGLCSKINFEPFKIDVTDQPPASLEHAHFLIQNLAFFEYARVDELLHTISCMENIVSSTGTGIAHSISTEVFQIKVDTILANADEGAHNEDKPLNNTDVSPLRLRQLSTGCIILSSLWDARTYLRRCYGLQGSQQRRESKTKASVKDLNKAPAKVHGVSGEGFVAGMAEKVKSLGSHDGMLSQCRDFVELLSVDSEVKVASEGEDGAERPRTPSGDEEKETPMPASGGSRSLKRKGSLSAAGTPHRKKRGRPSLSRKKSGKSVDDDYGSD